MKFFVKAVDKVRVISIPKYLKPFWILLKGGGLEGGASVSAFKENISLFCKFNLYAEIPKLFQNV